MHCCAHWVMSVHAPDSSKSLEDYEESMTKVRHFLREGRLTGTRRAFVAAVLNVESGHCVQVMKRMASSASCMAPYASMQILAASKKRCGATF